MMNQVQESYLKSFESFQRSASQKGQEWLNPIRQSAFSHFSELGFPTLKDEDWKFTNVAPIAKTSFQLPQDGDIRVAPEEVTTFTFPGLACSRLVFINGRYSQELSSLVNLPEGVKVMNLDQAHKKERDLLEGHLTRYASFEKDAFLALNTTFMEDGSVVHIPRGKILANPIHLLYLSTPDRTPFITHPRNLIVMEENSEAVILETHDSLREGVYFTNGVTELLIGENSVMSHYLFELESRSAYNVSTLRVEQGLNSRFTSHSILQGGALVRNNIHPVLSGEGSECLINHLFLSNENQHLDNYMRVEHASPHCNSRQIYKGILAGKSRGVFHGRIIVHPGAQKTDAKQTNRNILMDEALIDTKPQLEIYADDVKCTHGATIGQLDENALFYLRARGIPEELAKVVLLFAFANEVLDRMKVEPVRRHLETLVHQWMPKGSFMESQNRESFKLYPQEVFG